jgi:adenylosuccinate lyase
MPHKKNPITCERISGLARVIRSMLIPAYENICLWHERDITNSSVERIIIPDAFHLIHYMSKKTLWVLEHLTVYPARMMDNIKKSNGVYASQNLMNSLVAHGMNRSTAYKLIQQMSFKAVQEGCDLGEIALHNKKVRDYLSANDIAKAFDLKWFLRNIIKKSH